ncbi:MAG: hypothetical protein AAF236_06200 [Verrucomicrobiota bacterium]
MPKKTQLKAGCGILVVFSIGFVTGMLGLLVLLVWLMPLSEGWKEDDSRDFVVGHISRQLQLSEEEEAELRPAILALFDERYQLRKEYILNEKAVIRSHIDAMAPSLSEEQLAAAERMFNNWWRGKRRLVDPPLEDIEEG